MQTRATRNAEVHGLLRIGTKKPIGRNTARLPSTFLNILRPPAWTSETMLSNGIKFRRAWEWG